MVVKLMELLLLSVFYFIYLLIEIGIVISMSFLFLLVLLGVLLEEIIFNLYTLLKKI
nr:MAG TPA: hypothetical protein [Caudoviricetes sp.]